MLSVIVPVRNEEQYLDECITSILNQTYEEIEIILIDDASTDGSLSICRRYASDHINVVVIKNMERQGMSRSRGIGVKQARGEYITFVDADDWIQEHMYERLMTEIDHADLIISGINRYYDEQHIIAEKIFWDEKEYSRKDIENDIIPTMLWEQTTETGTIDPSLCTKIFKKDKIENVYHEIENKNFDYGEDAAILYPLLLKVENVKIVKDCYYYHRQRLGKKIPDYITSDSFLEEVYLLYRWLKSCFEKTKYWNLLKHQLDHFYFKSVELKKWCYGDSPSKFYPVFPFNEITKNADVVIYGAGEVGKAFVRQNSQLGYCNIVMWVDKNYNKMEKIGSYQLHSPDELMDIFFDHIVIAVDTPHIALTIKNGLLDQGIKENKIIWQSIRMKNL